MTSFVVAVDGSEGSLVALRWAFEEAEVHGAELTAVAAWSWLDQPHGDEFDPHYAVDDARKHLHAAVESALGDRAGEISEEVVCDLPAPGILSASVGADLLVVGARGHGGFAGLRLGSVSEKILEEATQPVVVVHQSGPVRGGRVVVGHDGSPGSFEALRWAAAEARLRGAKLTIVHAWALPAAMATPFDGMPDVSAFERAERMTFDQTLANPTLEGLEIDGHFLAGSASRALLELAQGAGLIVVGSRGRGRLASAILGSTSRQVVHHAECPVVVLRAVNR